MNSEILHVDSVIDRWHAFESHCWAGRGLGGMVQSIKCFPGKHEDPTQPQNSWEKMLGMLVCTCIHSSREVLGSEPCLLNDAQLSEKLFQKARWMAPEVVL